METVVSDTIGLVSKMIYFLICLSPFHYQQNKKKYQNYLNSLTAALRFKAG